jgi:hypothetical protein
LRNSRGGDLSPAAHGFAAPRRSQACGRLAQTCRVFVPTYPPSRHPYSIPLCPISRRLSRAGASISFGLARPCKSRQLAAGRPQAIGLLFKNMDSKGVWRHFKFRSFIPRSWVDRLVRAIKLPTRPCLRSKLFPDSPMRRDRSLPRRKGYGWVRVAAALHPGVAVSSSGQPPPETPAAADAGADQRMNRGGRASVRFQFGLVDFL